MTILDKLRRPATSSSHSGHHRRHSSLITGDSQLSISSSTKGHKAVGSLQRLSLALPQSNENAFGDFLTQEPEEMEKMLKEEEEDELDAKIIINKQLDDKSQSGVDEGLPSQEGVNAAESKTTKAYQRFSLLRFRHSSDPQLSTTFKASRPASQPEEIPPTPKIITTAPTNMHLGDTNKRKSKTLFARSVSPFRKNQMIKVIDPSPTESPLPSPELEGAISTPNLRQHRIHFEDDIHHHDGSHIMPEPPAYGDESTSSLAIPVSRLSESGGSEGSSGSHKLYARTTTTHTISTTTTFFRLKRKKRDKGPLFPLPERLPRPSSGTAGGLTTADGTPRRSMSPTRKSTQAVRFETINGEPLTLIPSPSLSTSAITNAPLGSPGPAIVRKHSMRSTHSGTSTPSLSLVPPRLGARGRSSTVGSLGRSSDRGDVTPQGPGSGRTSTSTNGRRSFGDLLSFSNRLRQNSAPPRNGSGTSPGTPGSKPNSMQIPREPEPELVYPARDPSDTPASYLERLEAAVPRGSMATILCKSDDEFARTCLRKYMRGFSYFQESIDMSIRKMLMEVELPKETQQIDRLLAGFADRYHECNPGAFLNADEASIVAFSILLLHSDNHNKNNKHKMQKADYVKNTRHGQILLSKDILECFYDNICYTPFIHFEDDVAVHSHRLGVPKPKKSLIKTKSSENLRGPIDPYTLILDNKLEMLRPPLKEVMDTEDTYSSTGTLKGGSSNDHHKAFMDSAVLQIISARSRPDAFMSQATISNPLEAQAGLVSIKIAKVGLVWRKDPKKKKAKRPWQEWGAILTDSKLYFFKDVGWTKKLMNQYEAHVKLPGKRNALIFKPPLTAFEPDAWMAMDDAVALTDGSYKKHKNAFVFIKHGGFEEVFLANSEGEMNDWVGKLNYAATFRTAGVRMRGLLGTNYEGRHLLRTDSEASNTTAGKANEQSPASKKMDPQTAWEILFYRHQLIQEKISGFEDKLTQIKAELDHLLRNARHLLLMLPIQQKSREAIVLAAGRMSAKLKWTRVEMWRSQTHVDILKKDLEAEDVSTFPPPRRPSVSTSVPRPTSLQPPPSVAPSIEDAPLSVAAVTTPAARRPSQTILDHIQIPIGLPDQRLKPTSPITGPISAQDGVSTKPDQSSPPRLQHQTSIVSSLISRQDLEPNKTDTEDGEERVLREAGFITADGEVSEKKRRASDSEKDLPNSALGDSTKERGTSVRRSLQRTLREASHVHHTPSHHRRKGKESGSSVIAPDEGRTSANFDREELKRGAGSFILHGKKASVITMSSEWQSMSKEERLKNRQLSYNDERAIEEGETSDSGQAPHMAEDLRTKSSAIHAPGVDSVSVASSRRPSLVATSEIESTHSGITHSTK